jgi:hypothetical protein
MSLTNILDQLKQIRRAGDDLEREESFEAAIAKYEEMVQLATDNRAVIAEKEFSVEDILAIAEAEIGYCYRQQDNKPMAQEHVSRATSMAEISISFSAKGRAHEEQGLIHRLMENPDYEAAFAETNKAVHFYEEALELRHAKTEENLFDEGERKKRLFRAYGLYAINHRDVARKEGTTKEARKRLLEEATGYAVKGALGLEGLGEKDVNARHTMGNIYNELILLAETREEAHEFYMEAKESLGRAIEYAKTEDGSITRHEANINYALFRAESNYNPGGGDAQAAFDTFLETAGKLFPADAREFRDDQDLYMDAERMGRLDSTTLLIEERIASDS